MLLNYRIVYLEEILMKQIAISFSRVKELSTISYFSLLKIIIKKITKIEM